MSTPTALATRQDQYRRVDSFDEAVPASARRIVLRSSGHTHGPITRLVSPSDIGELIKPFVFLDHFEVVPRPEPLFGIHPHSGIATLTVVLRGGVVYEEYRELWKALSPTQKARVMLKQKWEQRSRFAIFADCSRNVLTSTIPPGG